MEPVRFLEPQPNLKAMSTAIASKPRVVSIAGTDPTGGAGAQADIKAISAAGGYAMSVITSIVSQNTQGVIDVFSPPIQVVQSQLEAISNDVSIDAIKIGMLGTSEVIDCVHTWLLQQPCATVVLDPVMVSTSGHRLLDRAAEDALRHLLPLASLITPNIPELAVLSASDPAPDLHTAIEQGRQVVQRYGCSVLVKGGHLSGEPFNAVLKATDDGSEISVHVIENRRVHTRNTHGTGCSLSSAIATRLGAGQSLEQSVQWATEWLHGALKAADALQVGKGHGPVDHFHHLQIN
ncbi:Hydroxymethylpyrimidine/phosphomethylpyrimidine kinase [Corynebacterium pelargi]|uniref:Thiamine biosynthesis multifunctional protein ThiED n=2 Tax=Corynebacterium pelargi TaxID=1471400 RepID=A0A410W5X8_9CORY|nr:Hydroxymethylpyrimidine/phosphomethylpyrimidine kinase [Corynebacterium pelargi]